MAAALHRSASVVVVGRGSEPPIDSADWAHLHQLRNRWFPLSSAAPSVSAGRAVSAGFNDLQLRIEGKHVGDQGTLVVHADGRKIGELKSNAGIFPLRLKLSPRAPRITLTAPDEGGWFVPGRVELLDEQPKGGERIIAEWTPESNAENGTSTREICLQLGWVN